MDHSGFEAVTNLGDARAALRELCGFHGRTETSAVEDADGRILASEVTAGRDVPHYDRAAMDGYAVRASDTFAASDRSPVDLTLTEDSIEPGTASQVHTGSPIPEGGDAVVMLEYVDRSGDQIITRDAVAGGENVAPAGSDVEAGEHLFSPGHRLKPSDLALIRSSGIETVEVAERPRVSVIPTGEELVEPGTEPAVGETVETNGLQVSMLVEHWGGAPSYRGVVTDDEAALREALSANLDHDIVVTNGGSSVGERDLIGSVVGEMGELLVHGVEIKPGHPVGFGHVEGTPVLMLPGYPVSCLVTAVQFLRPAIAWMAGTEARRPPSVRARLTGKVRSGPGERTFARVRLHEGGDEAGDEDPPLEAEPVRVGGAGVMSSVAFADGWVVVPESREGIPAGETVSVQQWERSC